ncbi:MAG: F0F1 ATP synthase subunit alpha [Chloroflexi bacterium]|nr:F0F1 ATP synthase subunit alpha [Chloroflexota bacterium]MCI0826295.1 F0F1 ATP synthase subunit alpha [Chloroflexota bacterium]MCI0860850.1 F0F1 ATP synthase subunit alpha [Chloroflexota bacterium]MCI0891079.1 F0F1 ATP synthase subunit alpha [Chloroflexota bacterium]
MSDFVESLFSDLQKQVDEFSPKIERQDVGTTIEAGDGIARVSGLADVTAQELVRFENGIMGIAFNLETDSVGVIILGEYSEIEEGMTVYSTGRIASVPVGEGMVGRVINALGEPIDGKGPIQAEGYQPIERIAPGVVERRDVDTPVQTGIKAIDAMIPIGRGQRELIIGDRQTGKTALAIDTIINQRGKNLICIYVAIGQKRAAIARTVGVLERYRAMEHTVVLVSAADEPAALQYIAPYGGCAIGEFFAERGQDALIVYDDLSKHAWAYRQVSLLLRRPPGREAYPGDVFYLHSRLLERAVRLADRYVIVPSASEDEAHEGQAIDGKVYDGPLAEHEAATDLEAMDEASKYKVARVKGSGGSLTALPIIETLLGDVAAYIPTNVISITDGQIYLESDLFNAGIRPGINVGLSVSRVGGDAQAKAMKQVAGGLRLDMAAYRDVAAFAQFGSDLDKATQAQLARGQRLQEILKQPQYVPQNLEQEVVVIFAGTRGYADEVPVDQVQNWEADLLRHVESSHGELLREIREKKAISREMEASLEEMILNFNRGWVPE